MDPKKKKTIVEWHSPRNIYEVIRFHGLASFYRKFMMNFSSIYAPFVEMIKKEHQPFEWTKETIKGFKLLKCKITTNLVLALPYFQKLFEVKSDASGMAIGVVLSQEENPITYFSENFNDAM